MKNIITCYFQSAIYGWKLWRKLQHKYKANKAEFIFVFPDDRFDMNFSALNYIESYLDKKCFNAAMIILSGLIDAERLNISFQRKDIRIVNEFSDSEICSFIDYVKFAGIPVPLKVISLTEPFGSDGWLQKDGITMDSLVSVYFFEGVCQPYLKDDREDY